MGEKDFLIRRFENSDVDSIVQLLELAYKNRFSREWWTCKYRLNPEGFWGEQGDIWVVERENELIGHWAVIPEKMKIGPKTLTVAQAVDAATHPEYRGRGIFKTLVKRVCADAKNRYSFIYGYPDKIIHKSYLSMGWKDFRLVEFYRFLDYDRPLRSLLTNRLLVWSGKALLRTLRTFEYISPRIHLQEYKGTIVEFKKIERFPDEIDGFWRTARSEFEATIERTATFLNWRFSRCFGNYLIYLARSVERGEIAGYMVLRKTKSANVENILDIVDLHALPWEDKCILTLVNEAVAICKEEGLDMIHCRFPRWHKYADILHRFGFVSMDRTFRLMNMFQPRLIFYNLDEKEELPKTRQWFYTLADTDDA